MDDLEQELREIWTGKALSKESQDRLLATIRKSGSGSNQCRSADTTFRVTWDINVFAESAQAAAEEAWACMRRQDSTGCAFSVKNGKGVETTIDLQD